MNVIYLKNNFSVVLLGFLVTLARRCYTDKLETSYPPAEYCEGETYNAQCAPNEVILIHQARFGRMYSKRCFKQDDMHCEIDVVDILDSICSGRQSCSVNVVDVFQRIPRQKRGCLQTIRGFLEAAHKCVQFLQLPQQACTLNLGVSEDRHGYIASTIQQNSKCGSSSKPWILETVSEQRVNIILYDFGAYIRNPNGTKVGVPSMCKVYAVIKEEKIPSSDTVCGQYVRETAVYTSMSDSMQIRIMGKQNTHFLLKYEVMGCGTVPVPPGAWVKRSETEAVIGCDNKQIEWTLQCTGNQWQGKTGNCTTGQDVPAYGASSGETGGFLGNLFGSHWLAILAISAIAVSVAVCILIAGIIYIRKRHVYMSSGVDRVANGPGTLATRDAFKYGTTGVPKPTEHGGQVIYNGEGPPYRPFDPNDHEYLKTIERQRLMLIGQHPQQHFATLNTFQWPQERPEVEHIYELPKFETSEHQNVGSKGGSGRGDNGGGKGVASRGVPAPPPPPALPAGGQFQNFELDPRFAGSTPATNNSAGGKESNRNVNNRSV